LWPRPAVFRSGTARPMRFFGAHTYGGGVEIYQCSRLVIW
jgi:hypothetical protein